MLESINGNIHKDQWHKEIFGFVSKNKGVGLIGGDGVGTYVFKVGGGWYFPCGFKF